MIRKASFFVTAITLCFFMISCSKFQEFFPKNFKTTEDKKSYSMGYLLGTNIKKIQKDIKEAAFIRGLKDALNGKSSALSQQDLMNLQKQELNNRKQEGEKQMSEGQKFLENNKKQEGVKVTNSGLQYKALKEGTGKQPAATNTVEVHYRGTLIDGTEFDSSYKRNKTISFPLNKVIKGWTEGLQLMKEGSKYQFFIPSDLGYGASGTGPIPPNATLIFEVELIKVL